MGKLIYCPYIHHVAGTNSKKAAVFYKAVKYILELYFDAVETMLSGIKDRLNGRIRK